MKQIVIGILMVFATFVVYAKEKETKIADTKNTATMVLSGSVADENSGESLVGVEVKIEGTDLKTYTDFDGNFSFKNLKSGEYKVVSTYISYQKNSKKLIISPNTKNIKIKLQASN